MKLLLDTCTFIWLVAEPGRLSRAGAAAIDDDSSRLFLGDASVLEISLKWAAGKIRLPAPPRTWIEDQSSRWEVERVAIDREHLYRVTELPLHHRDPFDRLLVAQAIREGLTIVTPDPSIHAYPCAVLW